MLNAYMWMYAGDHTGGIDVPPLLIIMCNTCKLLIFLLEKIRRSEIPFMIFFQILSLNKDQNIKY